jgi:hypothetical protein
MASSSSSFFIFVTSFNEGKRRSFFFINYHMKSFYSGCFKCANRWCIPSFHQFFVHRISVLSGS